MASGAWIWDNWSVEDVLSSQLLFLTMGCLSRGWVEQQKLPQQSPQETFCSCGTESAWEISLRQQCAGSAGKDGCLDVAGAVTVATVVYLALGPIWDIHTEQPCHLSLLFLSFLWVPSCSVHTLVCSKAESAVQVQHYSHVLKLFNCSTDVVAAALGHKTLCFIYCKACSEESEAEEWRRNGTENWLEDTENSVKKYILTSHLYLYYYLSLLTQTQTWHNTLSTQDGVRMLSHLTQHPEVGLGSIPKI